MKKENWEKEILDKFGADIKRDAMCPLEDFIRQLLKARQDNDYKNGYNQCLKDLGKTGERWLHLYL